MEIESQIERIDLLGRASMRDSQIASREDYLVCREIMRAASKNYSFASSFLPSTKLHHVEALYALMRVGDDRVDVTHSGFGSPLEAINDWENTYNQAFKHGYSDHPVMRAYLQTAVECDIPQDTIAAYFRAMRDDLTITRFPSFEDLCYYMDGSAIPVGRAMTHILGARHPFHIQDALHGADSLSIAMQLSNFWRDIGYDWGIGRIYLPQEDLEKFKVSEQDIAAGRITVHFIDMLEYEFERTEKYYAFARRSIPMLASGRWAVLSGLEVYRAILDGIRRNKYDVFNHRAGASRLGKFSLALKALITERFSNL